MLILSIGLILGLLLGWFGLWALAAWQKHTLDGPTFSRGRRH
jgi:hypothetical protein